jgi:hypothetical protein
MKIYRRIKRGVFKNWTIRKSKYGWYSLYSSNGVCQTSGTKTLEEVTNHIRASHNRKTI